MKKNILVMGVLSSSITLTCFISLIIPSVSKGNNSSSSSKDNLKEGVYFICNGGKLTSFSYGDSEFIDAYIEYSPDYYSKIDLSYDKYTPTRSGYTFGGWYLDENLTKRVTGTFDVKNEIVKLYAYWKEEDKPSKYLYSLTNTHSVISGIASYSSSKNYELKIPSYIGGYPVKTITRDSEQGFDKENVYSVSLPNKLQYIYQNSFYNTSIKEVLIPKSVTYIGRQSFASNSLLESVTFENNSSLNTIEQSAFENDVKLKQITIPPSCESIKDLAFNGCTSLEKIDISLSTDDLGQDIIKGTKYYNDIVSSEEEFVFLGDSILYEYVGTSSSITIPKKTVIICSKLFANRTNISNIIFEEESQITTIGSYSFMNCTSLTSLTLPSSVKMIKEGAFTGISSSIDVSKCNFEDNTLPDQCFENYQGDTITLPNSITKLGYSCFRYCENIKEINLGKLITSIGYGSFQGCKSIENINIPSGVSFIDSNAFKGCISLKEITLPNAITSIRQSMFEDCTSLVSIVFNGSITNVSSYAFSSCSSLENISFTSYLSSIGDCAFKNCTSIANLSIPSKKENSNFKIGNRVFEGMTSSQTITFSNLSEQEVKNSNVTKIEIINDKEEIIDYKYGSNCSYVYKK